jgi:N-acetylglucosamine-6-sulfatase
MALTFLRLLLLVLLPFIRAQDKQQPLLRKNNPRPNVLFILTDDQDVQMGSLDFMPRVKEHLIDKGLLFKHHYCTVALCCPSRVSLWTGKAARKSWLYTRILPQHNDAHGLSRKTTPT